MTNEAGLEFENIVTDADRKAALDELATDARGQPMKNMNVECGIFCEERV